jgi:hypothetical protein
MSKYAYFLRGQTSTVNELKRIGVKLIDLNVGDDGDWPALQLPNGDVLAIAADDEGNGPGALHVYTKDQLETKPA